MKKAARHKVPVAGFSLVEVLVTTALMLLMFGGLFAGVRLMIIIVSNTQAEAGALAIATERLEYIRSLNYFEAGTIGGVVDGPVPQTATSSLNGITYTETVSIQYIDRPDDGLVTDATPDPIPQDSKRVVLSVSWNNRGTTRSINMQTDLIPPGLESIDGGGTIIVNVFDAAVQPLPGVVVHVFNDTFSPTIDDVYYTDSSGRAVIPGAPAGSNYQLSATLPGYSIDQTYVSSSTNPIPNRPPISVATGTVSTLNFQIDVLSDLIVKTIGPPVKSVFSDGFDTSNLIATSTEIVVTGSSVQLAGGAGNYAPLGTLFASTTIPSTLDSWESLDFSGTTTPNSEIRMRVYEVSGFGSTSVFTLIPDSVLPNNNDGFIQGPVNITGISASSYPRLALGATLISSSTAETPLLYDWTLTHIESESALPNIPFTLTGAKTIGIDGSSKPVYKYQQNHSTDGSGSVLIPDLEFDGYSFGLNTGSYTISEIIGGDPYEKQPGINEEVTLVLNGSVAYSLRTTVNDVYNNPIGGASVRLFDGGSFNVTQETSIYGQTYFDSGLSNAVYQIEVSAPGYDSLSQPVTIDGNIETIVQLVAAGSSGGGDATSTPPTSSTYLAGYNTRLPISINGSTLFGSVSDFPVYLNLADLPSSFFSTVQTNGADIRITEGDGLAELPFELVSIDTVSENGQLYFKAPSLSISTTTRFYVYYGSSTASTYADTDTYGAENVWTNNYLAVYHLEEDAAGSGNSGIYRDSTSNNAHGDDYVRDTRKSGDFGRIGLGQSFEESYSDYIELPHTVLDGETDVTLSFWYRTDNSNYRTILSGARNNTSDGANEYLFWFKDQNEVQFFSHGDPRVNFNIMNTNDWVWRHYVSVRDDGNNQTRLYINGVGDNENPQVDSMSTLSIASGGLFIGVDQDSVGGSFGQYLDDPLDEIRIAGTVRNDSWIANSYLNQNTPSSFYTIGSVETE